MIKINSNLFQTEKNSIKRAKELLKSESYDHKMIVSKFTKIVDQFEKLVKDAEKIIKISDGQQEYLHKVQNDLKKEIEERIRAEEKLKYIAAIDTLTGAYNRGIGLTFLDNEINTIRRNSSLFSVCYIDINKLKYVNDNFGHSEGDELIVAVCNLIREIISENDILCRLGGDEFIILFPNRKKEEAEEVLKTIISNINKSNESKSKPYSISFSYGIIQVSPDNCESIDDIIKQADAKMYEHKQKNKR